ncbi:hypothetical protein RvY_19423 [Ramazzottius varieornatus]|uniref:Uncharacterized protein n=2 Tax=Ramazzottius varieornatus TaxID=947166 RepID=A0A1D1W9B3_RAMVA|nr:hypothetical protein RvY_19423 [Ramazzottius varieornatus]
MVVSTKACALGSVRASCFCVMASLLSLYSLPPDRRFLYYGDRWTGEEGDSDEEIDEG